MKTKINLTARPDDPAVRRFEEMVNSGAFALFVLRVQAELDRARQACEHEPEEAQLRRAQGAVGALRTVLGLPAQILAEMRRSTPQ